MEGGRSELLPEIAPIPTGRDASTAAEISSPTEPAKNRVPLLSGILAVLLSALVYVVLADGGIGRSFSKFLRPTVPATKVKIAQLFNSDPPVGFRLEGDKYGRRITSTIRSNANGYLVVPIQNCATCIRTDFRSWEKQAAERRLSVVYVASASKERVDEFREALHFTGPIVLDPDGELHSSLNAIWRGRCYLFSPEWTLVWLDRAYSNGSGPFAQTEFVSQVARLNND